MAPHSSPRAWKIPWTEEPGRLQSMGSLRVGHDWATSFSFFTFMRWRRQWHPPPVLLPGKIPWTEEPGGLPSMGSHRVGHDWSDLAVAGKVKSTFQVEDHRELHCLIATCSGTQRSISHKLLVQGGVNQHAPKTGRSLPGSRRVQTSTAGKLQSEPGSPYFRFRLRLRPSGSGLWGKKTVRHSWTAQACRGLLRWRRRVSWTGIFCSWRRSTWSSAFRWAHRAVHCFWRERTARWGLMCGWRRPAQSERAVIGGLCLSGRSLVPPSPSAPGTALSSGRMWERSPKQLLSFAEHIYSFFCPCAS